MAFLKVGKEPEVYTERLYLMEFIIEGEVVLKCGKASGKNSIKRLMQIVSSYYNFYRYTPITRIIRDVEVQDVFKKETAFHKWFSAYNFMPMHKFDGYSEFFKVDLEYAMTKFDALIREETNNSFDKECHSCKITKSTIYYHTNKAKADGFNHNCKECVAQDSRSKAKIHTRIYGNQVSHSKTRQHPRPAYTADELKHWLHSQPLFDKLYTAYKDSGYEKKLVPSVDRINAALPYILSNIRLMTFEENYLINCAIHAESRKTPVWQVDAATGEFITEFASIEDASTATGITAKAISRAYCKGITTRGKLATTAGYCWMAPFNYALLNEDKTLLREEFRTATKDTLVAPIIEEDNLPF